MKGCTAFAAVAVAAAVAGVVVAPRAAVVAVAVVVPEKTMTTRRVGADSE